MSYRYLGGLVINPGRDGKGQSVKRGRGASGPLMAEQGQYTLGSGGLWDSGKGGQEWEAP